MDNCKYGQKDFIPIRSRVSGKKGPRRGLLPNYKKIGQLLDSQRCALLKGYETRKYDNDIFSSHYELSHACKLAKDFPKNYRQVLIQTLQEGCENPLDEWSYNVPIQKNIIEILNTFIPHYCRARYSILSPGDALDWHIDTDTSSSCRVTLMLTGRAEWRWRRRGEVEILEMGPGEIWFTNTGWPHKVTNIGPSDRLSVVLTTEYKYINKYLL